MATTTPKYLPKRGHFVHFTPRAKMVRRHPVEKFTAPHTGIPVTTLPVDSLGSTPPVFGMDHNDVYGICGPAMAAHWYVVMMWRLGLGKQITINDTVLLQEYLNVSGGDNGTDETMLVGPGGIWTQASGGLAGDPNDYIDDSLDLDITNVPLAQYALDQFFTAEMAWSVSDAFLNGFEPGSVWPNAQIPDPNNGHYVPLASVLGNSLIAGVNVNGFYVLITWGATCYVSPAFVASVQPQTFVAFSHAQFDPATGLDAKGRHVSVQGQKWVAAGGNAAKVAAVVASFPPAGPAPAPVPVPAPPIPVPNPPVPAPPAPAPAPAPDPIPSTLPPLWEIAAGTNAIFALGYVTKQSEDQVIANAGAYLDSFAAQKKVEDAVARMHSKALRLGTFDFCPWLASIEPEITLILQIAGMFPAIPYVTAIAGVVTLFNNAGQQLCGVTPAPGRR